MNQSRISRDISKELSCISREVDTRIKRVDENLIARLHVNLLKVFCFTYCNRNTKSKVITILKSEGTRETNRIVGLKVSFIRNSDSNLYQFRCFIQKNRSHNTFSETRDKVSCSAESIVSKSRSADSANSRIRRGTFC